MVENLLSWAVPPREGIDLGMQSDSGMLMLWREANDSTMRITAYNDLLLFF